jgi:hypothetical protein
MRRTKFLSNRKARQASGRGYLSIKIEAHAETKQEFFTPARSMVRIFHITRPSEVADFMRIPGRDGRKISAPGQVSQYLLSKGLKVGNFEARMMSGVMSRHLKRQRRKKVEISQFPRLLFLP